MSFPIKNDNDPFESYDEFLDNISRGGEIEFCYDNKKYTLTHGRADDGCHLVFFGVANSDEINEYRIENNNFDIIGDLKLGDNYIRSIVTEFEVFFRCF